MKREYLDMEILSQKTGCDNAGTMPCEHENGNLQAKEKGLEHIQPLQTSEGTDFINTLILDF